MLVVVGTDCTGSCTSVSLCTLTPEVQCLTFHQNHVVWQTKIKSFWRNGNDSKKAYSKVFKVQSGVITILNLKIFFYIFCKRQISIKLFYLYQRFQCTDNYFFKIKFVLFDYLLLSVSWKENDLSWYISVIKQSFWRNGNDSKKAYSKVFKVQSLTHFYLFIVMFKFVMVQSWNIWDYLRLSYNIIEYTPPEWDSKSQC
jgi:hypothetical protein